MEKRNRKKRKMVVSAVTLALLLAAVFFGATLLDGMQQRKQEQVLRQTAETLKASKWTDQNTVTLDGEKFGFDHRIETYLFIGTDASGSSDPDNYWGPMADFLLLMVLDHSDNTVACLQIDRNTVTPVRELDKAGNEITSRNLQICTAHWYGRNPQMAAENTAYAVRQYLGGLPKIDGYFEMSMEDVGKLNHAVGGVEVTILDELDKDNPALPQGETLTLTDEQAAYFIRVRMAVGSGTNAERMARQRQYMASFFTKVKEKTNENPAFGLELWDMLHGAAVSSMNGNAFSRIAQKLLKGKDKGLKTIRGETVLGTVLGDGQLHEEFYAADGAVRETMMDLFSLNPIGSGNETTEGEIR
ncbi:MAG: LCP family protein [Clostridia bacterium]|nr:LCP family protein [Clostridia bacterium]